MVNIKRGLTSKIFFLFFSVIIIAFGFVTVVVIYSLQNISKDELYYRLDAYCDITSYDWRNGKEIIPANDTGYVYGITQGKVDTNGNILVSTVMTTNMEKYLDEAEFQSFINTVRVGRGHYITPTKGDLFYVYQVDQETNYFIIMMVDDMYSNYFTQRVVIQIVLIFVVVIVLISSIVSGWVTKLVKRIQSIQEHVKTMGKNKYEKAYFDDGDDEIADLSLSVENMRLEIKQAEDTKREMLQNISHDFKTPIAVIKSYGEAIADGVMTKEAANVIIKQADSLKSKVNQLLQYNRLEYLNNEQAFENVNLKDVCQEIINNRKLSTKISFEANLEDCFFLGYRENYNTIIDNIVDNALRYAKTKIIITTKKNKVTIYNDGEAIEEKFLDSNFKPYEKGSKGQFGLGMSIVKKTVDFFGLNLAVYNEKYGGVSFVISKNDE